MVVKSKGSVPQNGLIIQVKDFHFNRVFHYKPSILGYSYFWKHPHVLHYHLGGGFKHFLNPETWGR